MGKKKTVKKKIKQATNRKHRIQLFENTCNVLNIVVEKKPGESSVCQSMSVNCIRLEKMSHEMYVPLFIYLNCIY